MSIDPVDDVREKLLEYILLMAFNPHSTLEKAFNQEEEHHVIRGEPLIPVHLDQ